MNRSTNVVVRTYEPARRLIVWGFILVLTSLVLYITYEFGRYDAGYDRMAVAQDRNEARIAAERLESENRELRTRIAEFDTIRIGRAREQLEVSRTIGELQAQVAKQTQELEFFRGIVAQNAAAPGVKIQQLRIVGNAEKPKQFILRFTLVRTARPDDVAVGTVVLSIDGASQEKPQTLDLGKLTGGKTRELRFNFRYFENFDQEIALPQGFQPERVNVELRGGRKDVSPLTQSFLWTVEPA